MGRMTNTMINPKMATSLGSWWRKQFRYVGRYPEEEMIGDCFDNLGRPVSSLD